MSDLVPSLDDPLDDRGELMPEFRSCSASVTASGCSRAAQLAAPLAGERPGALVPGPRLPRWPATGRELFLVCREGSRQLIFRDHEGFTCYGTMPISLGG
jgi:hypothetical protein